MHIGTLIDATYTKAAQILQRPEPSLCLTVEELDAVIEHGAAFVRFVIGGASTYTISLDRFKHHSQKINIPPYGPQHRVSVQHFAFDSGRSKRVPVAPSGRIELPAKRQMKLFN